MLLEVRPDQTSNTESVGLKLRIVTDELSS
jgi:hypothetical protein